MKILFACIEDSDDLNVWSGLVYYIKKALGKNFEVIVYDKIPFECPIALRIYHQFYKRFSKKTHHLQIEPAILKNAAKKIEKKFHSLKCDAVFCPGTGTPVNTFIHHSIPVFSYLDATKLTWIDTYYGLNSLCARSLKVLKFINEVGLKNNTITFFSSDWAMQKALSEVGSIKNKFVVVPFGANLSVVPNNNEINKSKKNICNLLFVGVDWLRKGGELCYKTFLLLQKQGFNCSLTIIGCKPDLKRDSEDDSVRIIPFLSKKKDEDLKILHNCFREAHFLILPTKADCTPIVFCEAAAFGLPVITTQVGGISSVINESKNGFMLSPGASEKEYAETIKNVFNNYNVYKTLCANSRKEYNERLNWYVAGNKLADHIKANLRKD